MTNLLRVAGIKAVPAAAYSIPSETDNCGLNAIREFVILAEADGRPYRLSVQNADPAATDPQVIDKAIEAMKMAGVEPLVKPIRGGTDGARLSFMGLPCPNIFTGGMNFHGRYEYCSLTTMHKAMQVILNLAQLWTK